MGSKNSARVKLSKSSTRGSSVGAVVNEFVLVVPLLLIFLTGLLEFGRTLNQVAWLSQTSYEAARVGGNSHGPQGQEAMQNVANLYYNLLGKDLSVGATSLQGGYDLDKQLVTVILEDKVKILLGAYELDLKFQLAGPHLALPAPNQSNEFANTGEYDCFGAGGGFDGSQFCCLSGDCSTIPGPGGPDGPDPTPCRYFTDLCKDTQSFFGPEVERDRLLESNELVEVEIIAWP